MNETIYHNCRDELVDSSGWYDIPKNELLNVSNLAGMMTGSENFTIISPVLSTFYMKALSVSLLFKVVSYGIEESA